VQQEFRRGRTREELETAAPVKRRKTEPFVKVPLWWAAAASKATKSPATLVLVELLRASWKARNTTFPFPNARLSKLGVSREVKRRVLRDLERAGLITVERRQRKTPTVTLISL
jgi:ribosomal protein S19E (S16A)